MLSTLCSCSGGGGGEPVIPEEKEHEKTEEEITDRISTFNHISELEEFRATNEIINGDFETGDLTGWYIKDNSSAFSVTDDDVDIWNNPVAKTGKYFLGYGISNYNASTEAYVGSIRSSLFILGGTGKISFSLAGNCTENLVCALMLHDKDGDKEICKFNNTRLSQGGLSGFILVPYVINVDLKAYKDKYCYLKLTDNATSEFGFISIDSIKTFYADESSSANFYTSVASFCNPVSRETALEGAKLVDIEFNNTLKTEYNFGEEFSDESLVVYGIYSNGLKATISRDDIAFSKNGFNKNVPGKYTIQVMVKSEGISKEFDVTVKNNGDYIRGTKVMKESDELLVFGDSQMAMWSNLVNDIGLFKNVTNIAVGGSTTDDWMPKLDLITSKNAPFVLMNLGGNDLRNRAKTPEEVANNMEKIILKFSEKSPASHIYMFEIPVGNATFYNYFDKAQQTVSLYKKLEEKYDNFTVISTKGFLLGDDGLPNKNKFRDDNLHINPNEYPELAKAFKKFIIK